MNLANLYISHFEVSVMIKRIVINKLTTIIWFCIFIVIIDISINLVFRYPENNEVKQPSAFQLYFEYGRSSEGKLKRQIKKDGSVSGDIVNVGWIKNDGTVSNTEQDSLHYNKKIYVYGMSHAKRLGDAIKKEEKTFFVRTVAAPGGTANYAFSCFMQDIKSNKKPDVAILGIMTDGIPRIITTSGSTMHFDMCYPYTYPRYYVENSELNCYYPPAISLEKFRYILYNKYLWNDYLEWLKIHDGYYNPLLFQSNFLDISSLFRLIRRAYAQRWYKLRDKRVYSVDGFKEGTVEIKLLRKLLSEFGRHAQLNGITPIIYIVNNPNSSDHLLQAVKPVLEENNILFLSSHEICPPDNPAMYDSSLHFPPEKDRELARAIINIMEDK